MSRVNGREILRRLNLLSSIRAKITFMLLAFVAMGGVAGYLTYQSFDRVSASMTEMTNRDLPQLAQSNVLIMAAGDTKDAMISVLTARDSAELARASDGVDLASADLTAAVDALPEDRRGEFENDLAEVVKTLQASIVARGTSFENAEKVNAMTIELQQYAADLQGALLETADDAYFGIAVTGEETIESIDETMLDLVENKFATLQNLLETRAEINFLTGVSLAMATTRDRAMLSILVDLALSSRERLVGVVDGLQTVDNDLTVGEDLMIVLETLSGAVEAGREGQRVDRDAVLAARQAADTLLAAAVDDMVFELTIAADDAATGNRDAIQSLLDNEVAFMNTLLEINSRLSAFQVEALRIGAAHVPEEARAAQQALRVSADNLAGFADFADGRLASQINGLVAMAQPDTGLAAFRISSLEADQAAAAAASATVDAVLRIAGSASLRGLASQQAMTQQVNEIATEATAIKANLGMLGWIALGFVAAAMVLNHLLIVRPLNAISHTTERLSQGDMRPVKGFERASDEIARIAGALTVFREGLVEKAELARLAEQERETNQARQAAAVAAIGTGLSHLARGDLTYRIEDELTEGYGQLKDDFNQTAETLNLTIVDVVGLAGTIRRGSSDVSRASDDLARRTENQAATLEETAAALEELTASVRSAAKSARDAEKTTNDARDRASESGRLVLDVVQAVKAIEDGSSQIARIIGVIDDIAFQTNLLALNAGVEAARAGEAGRGFAVVASEVRGLSQRTTEAAREIKALISNSTEQVETGVDLVGRAGEALGDIVDRVNHVADLVSTIAESTDEQATGLGEANTAISNLDHVTQQNASMVQETSEAGRSLSETSNRLAELTERFNVAATVPAQASAA